MKAVCEALGVARSNIAARARAPLGKPRQGRPALPGNEMVMAIQAIITDMPSYGYPDCQQSAGAQPDAGAAKVRIHSQ